MCRLGRWDSGWGRRFVWAASMLLGVGVDVGVALVLVLYCIYVIPMFGIYYWSSLVHHDVFSGKVSSDQFSALCTAYLMPIQELL